MWGGDGPLMARVFRLEPQPDVDTGLGHLRAESRAKFFLLSAQKYRKLRSLHLKTGFSKVWYFSSLVTYYTYLFTYYTYYFIYTYLLSSIDMPGVKKYKEKNPLYLHNCLL